MNFIPAKESGIAIWFFDLYTRWLLKRRFKHVWIQQKYHPDENARTVYFLNHNSWWDGLIPLFLNRTRFHQKARALMEHKQMHKYPFFSRIGAFSIDLENPQASLKSLRYAVDSLKRPNSSLFIYPEGKITHVSEKRPEFKQGLAWLYTKTNDIDYVPIAIHIHTLRNSKPELYIYIENRISFDKQLSRNELTRLFEEEIEALLFQTRDVSGYTDTNFKKVF